MGMIRFETYSSPAPNDIRNLVTSDDTLATVRGTVLTTPQSPSAGAWKFSRYRFGPPSSSFYLKVEQIKSANQWIDTCGTVYVYLSGEGGDITAGDYVRVYCTLGRFGPPSHHSQFDIRRSMQRRNICIAAYVKTPSAITILNKAPSSSLRRIARRIRAVASQALLDASADDEAASALLAALLLGERSDIDPKTNIAFQKTNLAHFISLSGLHLGILAATVWWCCRTAGLSKRSRAIVCAAVIALYVIIVPPRAPTLRAAVICWMFCLATFVRRKPDSLNTLSVAAVVLLMIRPADLFTAGWQLSYMTVLGIILLQKPIAAWILDRTLYRLESDSSQPVSGIRGGLLAFAYWAIELFATGLAAWLGGAGILLYHFHTIGPLSSLWTVIVFPLVWLILVMGFAKMVLAFILPTLSLLIGLMIIPLTDSFAAMVRLLADTGISQITIGAVPVVIVVSWYAFCLTVRFNRIQNVPVRKLVCVVLLGIVVVPLAALKYNRTHSKDLDLTVLSAGHGQSIVIRMPDNHNILFDTGSLNIKDPGSRLVVPFLRYNGITALDAIILSHADSDHINGIPEVLSAVDVDNIYAGGALIAESTTSSLAGYLSYLLKNDRRSIEPLPPTLDFGKARLTSLWPTPDACLDATIGENDKSQVMLVEFAGGKILLTSDIELYAQERLLELYPALKCDVLVMPHHGSTANLSDRFVEQIDPQTVIISCSRARQPNAYKPPSPIKALYTPTDGAITTKIKADGAISTVGSVN
jgi:competence protein ComEC